MPATTVSALAAPSSSTGITARKNGKSLARNIAKPLAGVLLEQPLRLAPIPAVARKALAHRPIFKTPRRDSAGESFRLGFIVFIVLKVTVISG